MRDAMGDSMRDDRGGDHLMDHGGGVDSLGVSGLSLVADLHHSAAISSISCVGHILDPAIRERHAELALDVALGVSVPALTEVSVVLIVMDPIGEAEGVRLVILLVTSVRHFMRHNHRGGVHSMDHGSGDNMAAMTSKTSVTNDAIRQRNRGDQAREGGETGDREGLEQIVRSNNALKKSMGRYLQSCWFDLLTNASE